MPRTNRSRRIGAVIFKINCPWLVFLANRRVGAFVDAWTVNHSARWKARFCLLPQHGANDRRNSLPPIMRIIAVNASVAPATPHSRSFSLENLSYRISLSSSFRCSALCICRFARFVWAGWFEVGLCSHRFLALNWILGKIYSNFIILFNRTRICVYYF